MNVGTEHHLAGDWRRKHPPRRLLNTRRPNTGEPRWYRDPATLLIVIFGAACILSILGATLVAASQ